MARACGISPPAEGKNAMGYDPKCGELARHFLPTDPAPDAATVEALAEIIQEAVEDWLEEEGYS
jgi:hypothetical protein